jgi:tRNA (Thr-GGU) A37 N-methylase
LRREGRVLHLAEVDMVDGTPVLDVKPFVPDFDNRPEASKGWTEKSLAGPTPKTRADGRFV